MKMGFRCDKCGRCCQNVGHIEELQSVDGVCANYDKVTRLCKTYATRPLVCRVEDLFKEVNPPMTIEEWYTENKEACNRLRGLEKEKP